MLFLFFSSLIFFGHGDYVRSKKRWRGKREGGCLKEKDGGVFFGWVGDWGFGLGIRFGGLGMGGFFGGMMGGEDGGWMKVDDDDDFIWDRGKQL